MSKNVVNIFYARILNFSVKSKNKNFKRVEEILDQAKRSRYIYVGGLGHIFFINQKIVKAYFWVKKRTSCIGNYAHICVDITILLPTKQLLSNPSQYV